LFTKRLPIADMKANCGMRFWLERILPIMLDEWTSPNVARRIGTGLDDIVAGFDYGLPRGLVVSRGDEGVSEVWHGGGLTNWMNVSLRNVAEAFDSAQNWRLVKCRDFAC